MTDEEYTTMFLEALVGLFWFNPYDPTFMLGIWNMGDWLEERFGLAQFMVRWYVEVTNLVGIFIC